QSRRPERVDVRVLGPRPMLELDAELEARVGFADQLILIDAEQPDDVDDGRDGRLADTDGPDLGRFDQTDAAVSALEELGQDCRRPPTGGSPADNGDTADSIDGHDREPTFNSGSAARSNSRRVPVCRSAALDRGSSQSPDPPGRPASARQRRYAYR